MIKKYIKFVVVGFFGYFLQFILLYLGVNFLFSNYTETIILGINLGMNISLSLAMLVAITSNFFLNMVWTWDLRKISYTIIKKSLMKFYIFSLVAVAIQFSFTNILSNKGVDFILANFISVIISSIASFYLNNSYTFRKTYE